jgi:hypothetical protein
MFEYELEMGHDREHECEFASEYESEQFLPLLGGLAARFAPQIIQGIGRLISSRKHQREFEAKFESESALDPYIANLLKKLQTGQKLSQGESEFEYESAFMSERELEMENFAYKAAQSESEAEAEAFLGALVPVAARLFPKSSTQAIATVTPSLIEGVATMTQVLHKSPKARPLMRTVPHILQKTLRTLANHIEQGKPVSRTIALRMLAGNTAKVLDNPVQIAKVMRKSHRAQHQHQAQYQPQLTSNGKRPSTRTSGF